MTLKPKEPILTIFLNALVLGWGHLYAGAMLKGWLILITNIILLIGLLLWMIHPTVSMQCFASISNEQLKIYGVGVYLGLLIITILILIDSYRCARQYNLSHNLERKISGARKFFLITGIVLAVSGLNFALLVRNCTRAYVAQAFKLPSGTMRPTLIEKDRLLANKFIYRTQSPQRGDIAVFIYPEDPQRVFIKRVIAKGGESVEIRNGEIYIDDKRVDLPAIKKNIYYNSGPYGQEGQKVTVPEGQYFVLGDNSKSSHDSRYWGFVPRKNFIGKAYKIYYPFYRSGPIEP